MDPNPIYINYLSKKEIPGPRSIQEKQDQTKLNLIQPEQKSSDSLMMSKQAAVEVFIFSPGVFNRV